MQIEITKAYLSSQGFSDNFPQRFWSKVNKDGPIPDHMPHLGNCWVWNASTHPGGYGSISTKPQCPNHGFRANRASWILHFGPIPEGLDVLHHCDNPRCVRPEHLWIGDDHANHLDMVKKKRSTRGERSGTAKYTWRIVLAIRAAFHSGMSRKNISRDFRIPYQSIVSIINGARWKE